MAAGTQMGPLCNLPHWEGVCANTARAIAEGAVVLAGLPTGPDARAVTSSGPPSSAACSATSRVEIFGPVLSVLEYETFDRAMEMLNGAEFGLTSALYSNSKACVQCFLHDGQHGMRYVNHGTIPDNNIPFGGVKNSGVGACSVGPLAVNFYTSEHSAYVIR